MSAHAPAAAATAPTPARSSSPRLRRRRTLSPSTARRIASAALFALRPVSIVWAVVSFAVAAYAVGVTVVFGADASGATAGNPISAIDATLGTVAAHTGPLSGAFTALPALVALVHALAAVLALAVLVRRRTGVVARFGAAYVLAAIAISAYRFWFTVVAAPGAALAGPDTAGLVTVFLLPTILVLTLQLAVRVPRHDHRIVPQPAPTERHQGRHV
jgi:hypothetical protein